jgi:hypothetical protein
MPKLFEKGDWVRTDDDCRGTIVRNGVSRSGKPGSKVRLDDGELRWVLHEDLQKVRRRKRPAGGAGGPPRRELTEEERTELHRAVTRFMRRMEEAGWFKFYWPFWRMPPHVGALLLALISRWRKTIKTRPEGPFPCFGNFLKRLELNAGQQARLLRKAEKGGVVKVVYGRGHRRWLYLCWPRIEELVKGTGEGWPKSRAGNPDLRKARADAR